MLKVKGINFYPKQVEAILLEEKQIANDYQIHLERVEGKDQMNIVVETTTPEDKTLAMRVGNRLFDMLGLHADIELVPIGSIKRLPGKAVRVVDHRRK
jgi:phenylacetate-CoA ligase